MSDTLIAALAKARAEFQPIKRDRTVTVKTKTGGSYTFAYSPLETILNAVTPALSAHGIALAQDIAEGKMVTIIACEGESMRLAPIPVNFREGMTMQEIGAMLTYASRYSLKVALMLPTEDDNDGNEAVPGNIYTVHQKGRAAGEAAAAGQAPVHSYAKAAELLRSCASLAGLATTWEALTGEERRALAYVKDEMKEQITAADELAKKEAGDAHAG